MPHFTPMVVVDYKYGMESNESLEVLGMSPECCVEKLETCNFWMRKQEHVFNACMGVLLLKTTVRCVVEPQN